MKQVAAMRNDYNLFYSTTYTTPWDAERIFGCVCDYGYTGVDCAMPVCPHGDDPISTGQVDEIQALSCRCASCAGTFTLSFRGETTRPLNVQTESEATLKAALEDLLTIRSVTVSFDGGAALCDSDGVSTRITFTHEHGDVPALVIASSVTGFAGTDALTLETGRIGGVLVEGVVSGRHPPHLPLVVIADGTAAAYGTGAATVKGTKEVRPDP